MRKIYFLALAIVACSFLSCQKAEEPVESGTPDVEAPLPEGAFQARLYFNLGQDASRAFGTGTTEPWEKEVKSLSVFVVRTYNDVFLYRQDFNASEIASIMNEPLNITLNDGAVAGYSCYFAAVANLSIPESVKSMASLNSIIEKSSNIYNGSFEDVTTKSLRPDGFVMSANTIQAINKTGSTIISLNLKRTVAKLEIKAQTTAAFTQKYSPGTITVNEMYIQNISPSSYVIEQPGRVTTGSPIYYTQLSTGQCLFYIFEHAKRSPSPICRIYGFYDSDGDMNTTADRFNVNYQLDLAGAGEGVFNRNAAYAVNVGINGLKTSDVSVTVSVADWSIGGNQNAEVGN